MAIKMDHKSAALRVCVDGVADGRIQGRVYSRRLTKPMEFSDIGRLLLQMEAVLDEQNFPQAFQRIRTFRPPQPEAVPAAASREEGMSAEEVAAARGTVGTFIIYVITRRNTTWQGFVEWLDVGERQDFNSVLELLKLADQHVFQKREPG